MSGLTGEYDEEARGRLARYGSVDDLANAHIETEKWARGRIPLPDDTAEGWEKFVGKMRPESADKYELAVPDGQSSEMADWFRGAAFDSGLHPKMAQLLNARWNQKAQDMAAQTLQAGKDELKAIELENPARYARSNIAIENMMKTAGFEDWKGIEGLEARLGAGDTWKFLQHMASLTGELEKVDGASVDLDMGMMTAAQAETEFNRMIRDKEIAPKMAQPGTPEYTKGQRLTRRMAQGD